MDVEDYTDKCFFKRDIVYRFRFKRTTNYFIQLYIKYRQVREKRDEKRQVSDRRFKHSTRYSWNIKCNAVNLQLKQNAEKIEGGIEVNKL